MEVAPSLEIRLLGTPRVTLGADSLAFRAPLRAWVLLAYLATNPGAIPRKRAAFLLWPDTDEESALANLRRHLALIDAALPAPPEGRSWFDKGRATVEWHSDDRAFVDAARFEALSHDPANHAQAVALYGGDFLEGVSDDEWVLAHRERLRAMQLSMLRSLAERYRAFGHVEAAIEYAEQAYRLDPWREDVLREVMALHGEAGDVAGGIAAFRAFRSRLKDELDAEPAPETLAAADELLAPPAAAAPKKPPPRVESPATPPTNLPYEPSPLIGRERLLDDVRAAVAESPLVTLTGPGGVGKTRIARRLAASLVEAYPDGAWLVDLAPVSDGERVLSAVATALGLIADDRALARTLEQYLRARSMLLVLDNCEHIVDHVARFAALVMASCPNVKTIATSREPLNVAGEKVVSVAPLAPEDAAALFTERVHAVDARFRLTDDNSALVADVCRQLDGLPLALELAAPRVKALGLQAVARLLAQRFVVLTGGRREALPRQQTLQALYEWSHDLLGERERIAFRRLAVFSGGWSLDAACAVCSDDRLGEGDVVDLVTTLVGKSLVQDEELADGRRRFRFLESTRQFALLKLDESGEAEAVARRHLAYFADLAARFEGSWLTLSDDACFAVLDADIENVRSALGWGLAHEDDDAVVGATLAVRCERLWTIAWYLEGRQWLTRYLQRIDPAAHPELAARVQGVLFQVLPDGPERLEAGERAIAVLRAANSDVCLARVLASYGHLIGQLGRTDAAVAAIEEAFDVARRYGDTRDMANASSLLAVQKQHQGDLQAAQDLSARAISLHEAIGSTSGHAFALYATADLAFARGDVVAALKYAEQARDLLRGLKAESRVLGVNSSNMAAYSIACDDFEAAARHAREAIALLRDMQDLVVLPLEHLGVVEALSGDPTRAARVLGFTDATFRRVGIGRGPSELAGIARAHSALEAKLGSDELKRCMAQGADMPLSAVLAASAPAVPAQVKTAKAG